MRSLLALPLAGFSVLLSPAHAQSWPQRQVTIVVPFGAGGSADLLARILATHMQVKYNVPVVVENRAGAGGSIGTGYVAKAAPDGYTLLLGTVSSIAVNAALYTKLPFDVDKDSPAGHAACQLPESADHQSKLPAKTLPELIAYLKANDGKVNYGSSGLGTSSHLTIVMLEQAIGTKMTHVPFKSTGDVVNTMLGGNIDLAFDSMTTVWPHAEKGTVRAHCGQHAARSSVRAGRSDDCRNHQRLRGDRMAGSVRAGRDAEADRRSDRRGGEARLEPAGGEGGADEGLAPNSALSATPDAFAAFARAERVQWAEVVKAAGVKID